MALQLKACGVNVGSTKLSHLKNFKIIGLPGLITKTRRDAGSGIDSSAGGGSGSGDGQAYQD